MSTSNTSGSTSGNTDAALSTKKLAAHQTTLRLIFSQSCLPFAEVTTFLLAKSSTSVSLQLGLHRDPYESQPILIIPAGPLSSERVMLEGKPTILRYLSRQFPATHYLYASLSPEKQAQVDFWLDELRSNGVDAAFGTWPSPQKIEDVTLADVALWDLSRNISQSSPGATAKLSLSEFQESSKPFVDSIAWINETLAKANLWDEFRFSIAQKLTEVSGLAREFVLPLIENKFPKDPNGGDFSIAVPRLKLPGTPTEIAKDLASKCPADNVIIKIAAQGIFLQFTINRTYLRNKVIPNVLRLESHFGENASGFGQLCVVEFSSPNIAKPFHVGHLRGTIIGNFIQNCLQANGWTTVSLNYLGDWGKQYGLLAIGYQRYGSEEELVRDPIQHLYDVYVQINKDMSKGEYIEANGKRESKLLEEGQPEAVSLHKRLHNALKGHPVDAGNEVLGLLEESGLLSDTKQPEMKVQAESPGQQQPNKKIKSVSQSINSLGGWGIEYGLLVTAFKQYGNEEKLAMDPISHLSQLYLQIKNDIKEGYIQGQKLDDEAREYFARMEEGDEESISLWRRFHDLSIVKYREVYQRFNVHFDEYTGESKYSASEMSDVVDKLQALGILSMDDGAQIIDLKQFNLDVAVVEKRNSGGMLYISRDIAAAIDRYKTFKFDKMYYVVGSAQEHHFKQLFKILELMGIPWVEKCQHISYGLIKTKDGNMSTRKGTVVFLEQVINDTQESMLEVMKKNEAKFAQIADPLTASDIVGMTAILAKDMSARRIKDYTFEWDRVLAFEGDTGPYLQYAHARLCSVERMAGFNVDTDVDLTPLVEPQATALLEVISTYPDVVREAAVSLEPCSMVSFCFRLAHAVMVALENMYVINQPREIAAPRLALYTAARITLGNAMRCLGMVPLERM